eukprot:CAMPEP_0194287346 /NCGR_PEP_ID=MMETSP0169-20130528/34564_1 /TAXON_ID=218684 /ORGANISM="Corethron pennatum, Strain L29A3" /LENGTH=83 /DNA_ID=CAMNT_0039034015 /DNA_START=393 /DNA_END=644 /DNA_ORIENTATION=+
MTAYNLRDTPGSLHVRILRSSLLDIFLRCDLLDRYIALDASMYAAEYVMVVGSRARGDVAEQIISLRAKLSFTMDSIMPGVRQ